MTKPITLTDPLATGPASGSDAPAIELLSVSRIWDQGPHNAFTDLIRYRDQWVCGFREASAHGGGAIDSRMRILASRDGERWESVGLLSDPRGDIRDAKFAITPDGRLMLLTAIRLFDQSEHSHQSLTWFTGDLKDYEGPYDVGDPSVWMWGIRWHKGAGYSIGYKTGGSRTQGRFVRLYRTQDGKTFETLVDRLAVDAPYPNENAIAFDENDVAHVLLRCDPDPAFVGTAAAPYTDWKWKQTDTRVGGPAMMFLPDGRLLASGRLYDGRERTSMMWIDTAQATVTESLTLPSGGDTSYAGMVLHEGVLWMSYYSSHEGKSSIYLARMRIGS